MSMGSGHSVQSWGAGLSLAHLAPMLFALPHLIESDDERPAPDLLIQPIRCKGVIESGERARPHRLPNIGVKAIADVGLDQTSRIYRAAVAPNVRGESPSRPIFVMPPTANVPGVNFGKSSTVATRGSTTNSDAYFCSSTACGESQ
jgi:hypothetical protein